MKRLLALLLLSASAASAEQATLATNTVLRTADSLVILKAGTVVQVLSHTDKKVTVKVGSQTGQISASALASETFSAADMMSAPRTDPPAAPAAAAPVNEVAATPAPASNPVPAQRRPAQTMYGKMVEKAADAAASHEKALVSPTDEVLGGK
jgi:hypothetical protein